jgi:hypothetical protein
MNEGGPHHWLTLSLEGVDSQSQGIGVDVWVTPQVGETPYLRVVDGNARFGGTDVSGVHLGLGELTRVHALRIVWPATGRVQVLEDVAVDQHLRISEPAQ